MEVILIKYKKIIILCFGLIILLGVFYKVSSNDNSVNHWSQKEKIEDFNYLYNILKDNYPFFEILKRQKGYDWLAHKEEFEAMIAKTKNDLEYYHTLSEIIEKINNGHVNILSPSFYNEVKEILNNIPKEYEKVSKPWREVINNKKSEKTYSYIQDLLQQEENKALEVENDNGINKEKPKTKQKNITLKIIEYNKIAYVKINSFSAENQSKDGPSLMKYWTKIKNYPYLIIDIRGNTGGSDLYWQDNIVSPLINQTMEYETYTVYRGGEYSIPFIKARIDKLYPISELPEKPGYPPELNTDFKYFAKSTYKVEPKNSVGFTGDIFILTDSNNFSSAENFCMFAKATNWATLVGERTRGGGGFDPILISLPNSGLLVRFPITMELNPDGTANEEFHTVPDIQSKDPLKEVIERVGFTNLQN